MRFRFKAFALHLLASSAALSTILGGLYLGWYRWPGWVLTDVVRVVMVMVCVDVVLGPSLTFIIAGSTKPRRVLTRDIAIIVAVQLCALGYGTVILRGTGGTPEAFRQIAHPLQFREQVQRQIAGESKA